jgi:hypothetical protein
MKETKHLRRARFKAFNYHRYKYYKYKQYNTKYLTRKEKKALLSKKLSKTKLKLKLRNLKVRIDEFDVEYLNDIEFCPKCGCEHKIYTGSLVGYPEIYEIQYCARCGFILAFADNSPWIHFLIEDYDVYIQKGVKYLLPQDEQDDEELSKLFNVKVLKSRNRSIETNIVIDVDELFNI